MSTRLNINLFGFSAIGILTFLLIAGCGGDDPDSLDQSEAFVKYFGTDAQESAVDLLELSDGYIILGSQKLGDQNGYYLIRTDTSGNNVWWEEQYILDTADADGNQIDVQCIPSNMHLYNENNNLILIGTATFSNTDHMYLVDVDLTTGDTTRTKLYQYIDRRDGVDLTTHVAKSTRGADIIYNGTDFLVLGSTKAKSIAGSTIEDEDWSIMLMSLSGDFSTINWERPKGFSGDDFGYRLMESNGRYYYLGSMTSTTGLGSGGVDVLVEEFELISGNEDRQTVYGTSENDVPANFIDTDAGIAITGTTGAGASQYAFWLEPTKGLDSRAIKPVSYSKTAEGELWNTQGADVIRNSFGDYFIVGQVNNYTENLLTDAEDILKRNEVLLLPMNGHGVVYADDVQEYGSIDNDAGNAVIIRPDGSLVIAATINFGGDATMITLLKTNRNGEFKKN